MQFRSFVRAALVAVVVLTAALAGCGGAPGLAGFDPAVPAVNPIDNGGILTPNSPAVPISDGVGPVVEPSPVVEPVVDEGPPRPNPIVVINPPYDNPEWAPGHIRVVIGENLQRLILSAVAPDQSLWADRVDFWGAPQRDYFDGWELDLGSFPAGNRRSVVMQIMARRGNDIWLIARVAEFVDVVSGETTVITVNAGPPGMPPVVSVN